MESKIEAGPVCMECGREYTDQNPEAMDDFGSPESGPRVEFLGICTECDESAPADDADESWCPQHGTQEVTGYSVTQGSDPYQIDVLACGHRVVAYGPSNADVQIVG